MKDKSLILNNAIQQYGKDLQTLVSIEEMSELIKEIIKIKRKYKSVEKVPIDEQDKIVDEIADVEICMEQLKLIFKCYGRVSARKVFKLDRLKQRLENG